MKFLIKATIKRSVIMDSLNFIQNQVEYIGMLKINLDMKYQIGSSMFL